MEVEGVRKAVVRQDRTRSARTDFSVSDIGLVLQRAFPAAHGHEIASGGFAFPTTHSLETIA